MSLPFRQWASEVSKKKSIPAERTASALTKLGQTALQEIVTRSPVGDPALWQSPAPAGYAGGLFKNNWFVDIGSISPRTRTEIDPSGSASLSEAGKMEALKANPYTAVYIHNSLPYAVRLEHGWSAQAPAGIIAVTVESLRLIDP
jgi:hypothetical protein